ncbi:MAG: hypothetical protein M0P72_05530 [Metallibacterium scheffleri]|jgi:hypothetical protein|uniref:hypothetical protein n=1 Tax=Metallibacterium scheffleri TaxID=993689 RepID=UPI0026EF777B|nr:hypothetical protein [Metallibacterium scheffleri]MCK9366591.1 hypothetical protein [Metallibacterium scheffleri]
MDQLQRACSALVDRYLYWQGAVLLLLGISVLILRATDVRDALLLGGVMLAALAVNTLIAHRHWRRLNTVWACEEAKRFHDHHSL